MKPQTATPMKKSKKKNTWFVIVIIIILLFILTLAVLPFFINPIADSLVKQQIAALFGNSLKINSVTVSFLTGAVVKVNQINLAQAPGFGGGSLLKADSINVRVALMPLLKKQLVINDIAVIRPEVHLIQYYNGNMNLDYYLAKFSGKKPQTANTDLTIKLNQFSLKKAKIIFMSYAISEQHQPTFVLTNTYLSLKNIVIPNPDKAVTHFRFSSLLGISHQAQIEAAGKGILTGNAISFSATSKISDLTLTDYAYLVPNSTFTIKSGKVWVSSTATCKNNYLHSYHHVDIKNLQIAPKKGHALEGTLLGVPANVFTKVLIEDGKGMFNLDFSLSGRLNDLKANIKFQVLEAISKSLQDKLGLGKITKKAFSGVKKAGNKVINTFKGIFKHKKS